MRSPLRSPAQVEGPQGVLPQPEKDLERPSSSRLEARFSTPSNCGISGKYNKSDFYKNSPSDHFSIWNPKVAKKILKKYGFKTVKVVSTGIHPERYPFVKKHSVQKGTFMFKLFELHAKLFKLGDTFEIYAIKK